MLRLRKSVYSALGEIERGSKNDWENLKVRSREVTGERAGNDKGSKSNPGRLWRGRGGS